jgi:hypothetical protein
MESAAAYKRRLMKWKEAQWPKDHPNGQFIISRYNKRCSKTHKRTDEIGFRIGIKIAFRRGFGVQEFWGNKVNHRRYNSDQTLQSGFYPSGTRKTTRYETKEQFLAGCDRLGVPDNMLEFFLELYEEWVEKNGSNIPV